MSIKDFAVKCYSLTQEQLFAKCLELYEITLQYKYEETEINATVEIEVKANNDGYLTDPLDYEYCLGAIKQKVPSCVAILHSLPVELGLYKWKIVTVAGDSIRHQTIKVWIIPTV